MLRRAVELEPSSYDFAFALGDFLLRRGRLAEVGEVADRMAGDRRHPPRSGAAQEPRRPPLRRA